MVHRHAAGVGIALGQRGDDDFGNRVIGIITAFGFIPPDDNHAVVLVLRRSHDLRNDLREKVIARRNGGLVAGVMYSLISKAAVKRTVGVVILVGCDPVVTSHCA